MRVVWSETALADRREINAYISPQNPAAAIKVTLALRSAARLLRDFPERGRPGMAPGLRELASVPPYLIIYGVDHQLQILRILRIWHAARERDRS